MPKRSFGQNKIFSFFSRLSNRIILIVSFSMAIVISIVIFVVFQIASGIINTAVSDHLRDVLTIKNTELKQYVMQLSDYSLILRNDERFMRIIAQSAPPDYEQENIIKNQVRNMFYGRSDIFELELYLPKFDLSYALSRDNPNLKAYELKNQTETDWYKNASQPNTYIYYTPGPDSRTYGNRFFTFYRAIINIADRRTLALVKITTPYSSMARFFQAEQADEGYMCLFDDMGRTFYVNRPEILTEAVTSELFQKIQANKPGLFYTKVDGSECTAAVNSFTGNREWFMALFVPTDIINKPVEQWRGLAYAVGAFAIILSAWIIMLLTNAQTSSLKKLTVQVEQAGAQGLAGRVSEQGGYEVLHLARGINAMLERISGLVEKSYISEINEKTAQLAALEAQLNPHFLYNALQAISAKALATDNRPISRMIDALAYSLRYLIKADVLVTVKEELGHLGNYFLLQKARFEEKLEFTIDAQPETLHCIIPKISIQLLAENSIKHGLEHSMRTVHIAIAVSVRDGLLHIRVEDDAAGIEPEKLAGIRRSIQSGQRFSAASPSVGLPNLYGRLSLLFGEKASFTIDSTPGTGTVSTIVLPYEALEDDESDV